MPRKSKAPTGTVEFVNKPTEEVSAPTPAPSPSILAEPPKVEIPEQGTPTTAPAPPPAPKAKRAYKKKNEEYWTAMKGSRKELIKAIAKAEPVKETKNEVVVPPAPAPEPVPEKKKPGRPKKEKAPPAPKPVKEKPVKPPKPIKAPKPPPPPKKVRVYEPSSDEDDDEDDYESEEESESEEEPEVEVVARKAVKRIKTLEKIDRRIKALSNPYTATNRFSVF